jgi:D-alanine-D-alanine ligase
MTATSLYPQSATQAGYEFGVLMDKLIELAIEENKRTNLRRAQ